METAASIVPRQMQNEKDKHIEIIHKARVKASELTQTICTYPSSETKSCLLNTMTSAHSIWRRAIFVIAD